MTNGRGREEGREKAKLTFPGKNLVLKIDEGEMDAMQKKRQPERGGTGKKRYIKERKLRGPRGEEIPWKPPLGVTRRVQTKKGDGGGERCPQQERGRAKVCILGKRSIQSSASTAGRKGQSPALRGWGRRFGPRRGKRTLAAGGEG